MRDTYWENNGKHQKTYDRLKKLVPAEGKADSMHIELLRCACNIYYDFYNNGAYNLCVFKDQLLFIQSWADEIKAKMRSVRGQSPFDKIIEACIADAINESNFISAMLENKVTAVYDGYEKIMDAIIIVVEEREQNSKFVLVSSKTSGLSKTNSIEVKQSSVQKQAEIIVRPRGYSCDKWFRNARPGDCLVLSSLHTIFCINTIQKIENIK